MKYHFVLWVAMTSLMKPGLRDVWPGEDVNGLIARAKPIYKELLSQVEGVSDQNPMAHNITMSLIIIALWLASERKLTPAQMSHVMDVVLDWKPLKWYYGRIDLNTEKGVKTFAKSMHKCADWAAAHPEDISTWDFHFDTTLHKDGFYYHFTHCPIADFCRKYGYEEINPVLCKADYTTIGFMHAVLHREHTVAEGGEVCDYWIVGDRIRDPQ